RDTAHCLAMTLQDLATEARRGPLDEAAARAACDALLDAGQPLEARVEFLLALHERGETARELHAFAAALLDRCVEFPGGGAGLLDVCGTGGDRSGTFNISTAVMFVAAGAGARVAKHGNRGITSRCGGADLLEALGVGLSAAPEAARAALDRAGCCFLFAPSYHPAVKAVAPVRTELARRGSASIFNLLGPLINPARPSFQLVGVFDPSALDLYAEALAGLGREFAWAVHGTGPGGFRLDEVSTLGPTEVAEARQGQAVRRFQIQPSRLGLPPARAEDLCGGDAAENARIVLGILDGTDRGLRRDIVCLNAAAALVACQLAASLEEGLERARHSMDSKAALRALEALRAAQPAGA
ncbi:MAG: anthranilate phosphoribosyltransferase, partial [Terrimicrobiaceae bacterium]|nr:anthranilate phosphoribosyltransferase [Terrimicrobiaceae bacterium]